MKKTFIFILTAIALTAISCNKNSLDIGNPAKELTFLSSETVPSLSIEQGTPMNLVTYDANSGNGLFKLQTNVPCITGKIEGIEGMKNLYAAFIQTVDENGNISPETDITEVMNGKGYLKASRNADTKYTADDQYILVENPFTGSWVNYCNDGPLQVMFTIRTIGRKGTKYIDFSNPIGTASNRDADTFDTYAEGTVKAISSVTSGSEKRALDAQKAWGQHFSALANDSYAAVEYVTLTITDGENDFDIKVWGTKRENEIGKLLEYIQVDDTVEVPVTIMKGKKEINRIHASAVLKK